MAVFVKAVEAGSFSRAAAELGVSPSVVSHHISSLEKRYNLALLHRSTRKIRKTAAGEEFYHEARAMLQHAEQGLSLLRNKTENPSGVFTVALPAAFVRSDYSAKIAAFARAYPDLDLRLIYADVRQDLLEAGIDVAIRVGKMPDSSLLTKSLGSLARTLVCHPDLLKGRTVPEKPSDLESWPWIQMAMMPPYRELSHPEEGLVRIHHAARLQVDNADAMHQFSLQGMGLSSPPEFMVREDLKQGRLVEILPDWTVAPMAVHVVWASSLRADPLIERFLRFMERNGE